jgi:hypothetical protein
MRSRSDDDLLSDSERGRSRRRGLTPDAQHGAVVDGGNLVYFFSGIPQHAFVLSPNTVDITNVRRRR